MITKPLKESLLELIELSKDKVVKNQAVTFEINTDVKKLLEVELEKDCSEYQFQIDIYAIKHIFKEHGDSKKEENRGQIAVQDDDIILLLDVLQEPDLIFNSGKNNIGKDTVTFVKMIDDKYVVVQEVREGRKTIALNSMRIFKTKRTK
jgi:hypothetical protein